MMRPNPRLKKKKKRHSFFLFSHVTVGYSIGLFFPNKQTLIVCLPASETIHLFKTKQKQTNTQKDLDYLIVLYTLFVHFGESN